MKKKVYKLEIKVVGGKIDYDWKWREIFRGSWNEVWEIEKNLLDEARVREVKGDR